MSMMIDSIRFGLDINMWLYIFTLELNEKNNLNKWSEMI